MGEPARQELFQEQSVWVGPTSPKNINDLKKLTIPEIINFLKNWKPKEGLQEASRSGLARNLNLLISENPHEFVENASSFYDLEPNYIQALFEGLTKAQSNNKSFSWENILELSIRILTSPPKPIAEDSEWSWLHKVIARLMVAGMDKDSKDIHFKNRKIVWKIIELITNDPDPSSEREKEYLKSDSPRSIAINSTRGEAIEAAIKYGLWVAQNLKEDSEKELSFNHMPELKEVLDTHLNSDIDPSLAICSIYGIWFPWLRLLDPNWTKSNLDKIFPSEEKLLNKWESSWGTFIAHCHPYDDVFEILIPKYSLAIERLGIPSTLQEENIKRDNYLAEHLSVYYLNGQFNFNDPKDLYRRFWGKASPELKVRTLRFFGRVLFNNNDPLEEKQIIRLQNLWNWRLTQVEIDSSTEKSNELSAFGWWFASNQFEEKWAISNLVEVINLSKKIDAVDHVVEKLSKVSDIFLNEAVVCLQEIVQSDIEGWEIMDWQEEAEIILSRALQNEMVKDKARNLIHFLGERGYFEFGDLLKK